MSVSAVTIPASDPQKRRGEVRGGAEQAMGSVEWFFLAMVHP